MSDKQTNQTPTGVFSSDTVDTRGPTPGPAQPVSSSDILGANWTLTYQDMAGQPLQAEIDAYSPIINELDKRDTRGQLDRVLHQRYLTAATAGMPINTYNVWEDVERIRRTEPDFLKDIPAKNPAEFTKWVQSRQAASRAEAQNVVSRESGLGQKALGFGTSVVSSFADPINLGAMVLTGGTGGGARSLISTVARDALTNAAIETAQLPSISSNRGQYGETMSPLEMVEDVATAGVGGALFPIAGRAASIAGKPLASIAGDALAPAVRGAQRTLAPLALSRTNLAEMTDAEIAQHFSQGVPFQARTPDDQAALHVLNRDTEIQGASPYVATPGGMDANAGKMTATMGAISQPATAGPKVTVRYDRARDTTPLTQDRVIGFVLNDLEGGAKVVNNGDGAGTTKFGVTQRWNPGVDVANLTEADATRIARQKYWLPEFNRADPRVAAVAFDANYIASPSLARRIIAEAGDDVDKAISIYREHLNHLADTDPTKAKFKKGWNNRVDKLARFVGDAESSRVQLDPNGFEGDDTAYRAAQEQLNTEELRLADDTPAAADPVREFVDRQMSGEDLSGPENARFAADNAQALQYETARRAELGTDTPRPADLRPQQASTAQETPTKGAAAPDQAQAQPPEADMQALSTRVAELEQQGSSINPDRLARALGTDRETAQRALTMVAGQPKSGLRIHPDTGRVTRAPIFRGPKDVLRTIVEAGGIRDDEGHALGKFGKRSPTTRQEYSGRDWGNVLVPGVGQLLSKKNGLSVDQVGELLHEAGFFHDRPSVAEVLDTVERAVHGEKIYSHHDFAGVADRTEQGDSRREWQLDQGYNALIDRVPQEAIDDELTHDVAYLIAHGLEEGDAVSIAIDWRKRSTLDMIEAQSEDPHYDIRAAQEAAFGGEDGSHGGAHPSDNRPEPFAGIEASSPAGDEAGRWPTVERPDGAATDAAEEAGLTGPPPLDPKAAGIDNATGPQAERVADSLEHDARAALDRGEQVDPAIVDRQKQQGALKAASPMQAKVDQEGTMGLGLFDKADQPGFLINLDGEERPLRDVIAELDRDAAAIKSAKDCQ